MHRRCTKKYPKVSFGGFSYMLLWFCPVHGHSYGFHLIEGGEGPKDVMSSLQKFKPTMPEELFYDNTCNLSQYVYNREPQLFKNTHFWHDLFHSIAYLCEIVFKSSTWNGWPEYRNLWTVTYNQLSTQQLICLRNILFSFCSSSFTSSMKKKQSDRGSWPVLPLLGKNRNPKSFNI